MPHHPGRAPTHRGGQALFWTEVLVPDDRPRMGLSHVFARLVATREGRRAIGHLKEATEAETGPGRRHHLRAAVRAARRALTGR